MGLSNQKRFEHLVLPHLDAGYNLARWLARDADDAADVVQDACLRALKYIDALRGHDARPWFLRIVRHAYYDWCSRNRPADLVHDDNETVERAVDLVTPGPEQAALRRAERGALLREVGALPVHYREVLILREVEELSYAEIAAVVDVPVGTVMSRLARARALLQRSPLLQAVAGYAPKVSP
jgi:RNA polymerase sigma-70 factor (ECF subfamily)